MIRVAVYDLFDERHKPQLRRLRSRRGGLVVVAVWLLLHGVVVVAVMRQPARSPGSMGIIMQPRRAGDAGPVLMGRSSRETRRGRQRCAAHHRDGRLMPVLSRASAEGSLGGCR